MEMTTRLGEALKARREELGLSVDKTAYAALDTNRTSYHDWEKGRDYPHQLKWIPSLAEFLQLDELETFRLIREARDEIEAGPGDADAGSPGTGQAPADLPLQGSGGYHAAAA